MREENIDITDNLKELEKENENLEKLLIEAKMHWADLDLENEELAFRLKQRNDQVKVFSS